MTNIVGSQDFLTSAGINLKSFIDIQLFNFIYMQYTYLQDSEFKYIFISMQLNYKYTL